MTASQMLKACDAEGQNYLNNVLVEDEDVYEQPAAPHHPSQHTPVGMTAPAYYSHGLQYIQPRFDTSVFRTVLVYGIPSGTTLADIIQGVTTGPILSSQLVDTTAITGSLTARLVFVTGQDAVNFMASASDHRAPIMFAGDEPRVAIVSTPTYPSPNHIIFAVRNGATHRLLFSNMSKNMPLDLFARHLLIGREPHVDDVISDCVKTYDGKLLVTFSSVELAMWVTEKLRAETYGQIEVCYFAGLN